MRNKEIWKDVVGYEGSYVVSNNGIVKSLDRKVEYSDGRVSNRKGKILTVNYCRKGYSRVKLSENANGKYCAIHRLVGLAFIANPNNLPQINHIDGVKDNNNMDNLEWVTNSENAKHAVENGLQGNKGKPKPIGQYTLQGILIKEYPSGLQAQRETGIYTSGISMCARGLYKQYKGYIWRFLDD